jgi:hypothetical protein
MPVIGLKFSTIEGKRSSKRIVPEVKINSSPKIVSVKEADVTPMGKKALSLEFEFTTKYAPDIGEIKMSGEVIYLSDKNAKVIKEWKAKKTLPEGMNLEVLNYLFRACLIKISVLADDLQLPPAVQLPRVRPKSDQSSYIG